VTQSRPDQPAEGSRNAADDSALRDELRTLICTWNPALTNLGDSTSLIASGLIDSLALFNLILWIETKSGRTLDAASIDAAREWDSITAILRYLDRSPDEPRSPTPQSVTPERRPSRYQVVKYDSSVKRAVAEFQTGLWSPDHDRNLRYLEWKYEDNPFQGGHIFLALDGDNIVGMRGFYPSLWEVGVPTRRIPFLVADDLLVAEQHRNKGLVSELMRTARDHLRTSGERYVINISGGPITVVESLATGWRSAGLLGPIARKRSRFTQYPKLRQWVRKYISASPANRGYQLDEPTPFSRLHRGQTWYQTNLSLRVEIDDRPRISAMIDLIQRIGHDGRWRHVRDELYLRWRYRNPLREYRFLYAGDERALSGFLVLRRSIDRDPPSQEVSIVDIEAVNEDVKSALLNVAIRKGGFDDIAAWMGTLSGDTQNELRRLGFSLDTARLTASATPCILVWSLDQAEGDAHWDLDGAPLLERSEWDMRSIYTMVG
jgi:GNAT superfamily N-acetyltransferase